MQPLQQRQHEACGLAGPGLRGAKQITAGEHLGDGLGLNRGGLGVTLLVDSTEQLGQKAEIFERRINVFLLNQPATDASVQGTGSGR